MAAATQTQTATELSESNLDISSKRGNLKALQISQNLTPAFINSLVKAMNAVHSKRGKILGLKEFTLYLASDPAINTYLQNENIKLNEVLDNLAIDNFSGNENKDIVLMHPQLKTKILEAYNYGVLHNEPLLTPLTFIKCLVHKSSTKQVNILKSDTPNLSRLVKIIDSKSEEEIVGRENEARIIIRTLFKNERNNLIMIGEPGAGKGYVVKKFLAIMAQDSELQKQFSNYTLLEVNFAEILSIAQYRENEFNSLLKDIENSDHKIFYFPNLDLKAIAKDGLAIEYIFSAFLKNNSNRLIIGCSYNTYQATLQKVALFNKNFETLNIEEPMPSDLEKIIGNRMSKIERSQGLSFSDHFITDLIDYSRRFIPTKAFPDKALNLLEEIVVGAKLKKLSTISTDDLKEVLAQKTGIPLETLSVGEKETLLELEQELNKVIIGQQLAVKSVVQAIQRSRVGLKNPNKPIGSFLFLGPTGVGKTEFAKQLARIYFKDEKAFMRFDMSEYSESHTNQKLIGAPPGYAGYDEGGVLTNYVMQKPYSLLLFDEVEKAHPKTYDLFLQILDDGRLTDAKGHLVDFKNTILIFTSNIGSLDIAKEAANSASLLFTSAKAYFDNNILPQLSEYLRIELINRFDEIIPFLPLDELEIYEILLLKIAKIRKNVEAQGYKIEFPEADLKELAKLSYDPKFGAREIDRVLRKYIENPIAAQMLNNQGGSGTTIYWKLENNGELN